ncbi:MAG: DUF1566 domain-containing protein [Anaerolineae bacterium]|nr:DUF1566 domain-containing protein [Anaerolineae bacterium]
MRTKLVTTFTLAALIITALIGSFSSVSTANGAGVVDTGQSYCYDEAGNSIPCPAPGEALFGQDANYASTTPAYRDNGDGTISDLNTGLMWTQAYFGKMTWTDAMNSPASVSVGGYTDWRMPTIKELYSLIDFDGITGTEEANSIPYIDTTYFAFGYGNLAAGERMIDAQYWSSTEYTSTTMGGSHTVFGVNFADGRIKGYGTARPDGNMEMTQYVRYVRNEGGYTGYGVNVFVDNGNGTITDNSTSLMWMQTDSGSSMNWAEALSYCENLDYAGQSDWRLPDAKELQGIVDYARSLDATHSAAIDPLFSVTPITDEFGQTDYAFYWTSTTHLDGRAPGDRAVYIAFGEALGYMNNQFMDVHGAGAQRSDLKMGDPSQFALGMGPQGDVQRIYNLARCVRGGNVTIITGGATDPRPEQQAAGTPPQGAQGQQNQGQQGQGLPGQGQQGQGQAGQGQPPQAAIDACNGLSVGAACTVNTPNGTVSGACTLMQNNVLACVPAGQ